MRGSKPTFQRQIKEGANSKQRFHREREGREENAEAAAVRQPGPRLPGAFPAPGSSWRAAPPTGASSQTRKGLARLTHLQAHPLKPPGPGNKD